MENSMLKKMTTLLIFGAFTVSGLQAQEVEVKEGMTTKPLVGHQHVENVAEGFVPDVSGYVGVVSSYVWRGVPQGNRATSVQGGIDLAVDGLNFGTWIASIGGATGNETDYYVSYEGDAGGLGYTVGLTLYSYDFKAFKEITKDGKGVQVTTQKEFFVGASYGDFSGTYYMVPAEDSTYAITDKATSSTALNLL